ncbi:SAGA complex subunit Sgf73 [Coemansia erecta]|uniref:SAGA complex subunit Sgf73 n=1 Tax=Coemansia erecta TaxID=147472 RepID=A0A9W8CVL6_9FUNG|nr:SAGA complex subunit Sgf73 [Coemansia erecta]
MTGAGNQRVNVIRRGLSASGSGGGSVYGTGGSNGSGYGGTSSVAGGGGGGDSSSRASSSGPASIDGFTDDQKRALRRKIDAIKSLEKGNGDNVSDSAASLYDVERLKDERIRGAARRLDVEAMATVSALATFGQTADWRRLDEKETGARQPLATPTRLTWEMIKKAVAEEDKYQSKKNWSSTKGRGNRKAPVARRLDAEVLKRFGVYPSLQFPMLATCDSCGRQINAHFLRDHQETNCTVSEAKRSSGHSAAAAAGASAAGAGGGRGRKAGSVSDDESADGGKRTASEANLDDARGAGAAAATTTAKKARVSKKEQMRLEKEQREKEKLERREQQRLDKERKKQEREAKRERDQAKARQPVDLDKQCGVVAEPGAAPCSRSLTCKTHSMAMKRAVLGRSKLFDALLQAHLAKSRSAAAAKNAASRSAAAAAAAGSSGSAVRDAMAMVLGEEGRVDACFFDDDGDEEDIGSDEEAERVIAAVACSRGKPLAVRPTLLPRRRHHYLRVRDLFFDALKPPMGSAEQPESLAT